MISLGFSLHKHTHISTNIAMAIIIKANGDLCAGIGCVCLLVWKIGSQFSTTGAHIRSYDFWGCTSYIIWRSEIVFNSETYFKGKSF